MKKIFEPKKTSKKIFRNFVSLKNLEKIWKKFWNSSNWNFFDYLK